MTKYENIREDAGKDGAHWEPQMSFCYNKLYSSQTTLLKDSYKVL